MSTNTDKPKIYDCFPFFKELDIAELRIQELWDTVDYFVIAEATSTHSGKDKPLYLKDNWARFEKYSSKIRHIVVDDMPRNPNPWIDENFQRNALRRGLMDIKPNDLVVVSDCDEIPRPDYLKELLEDQNGYGVYVLCCTLFYYRFNMLKVQPEGSSRQHNIVVTRGSAFKTPQYARDITFKRGFLNRGYYDSELCVIEHGGWHFTFFGDTEFTKSKIESFAHHIETNVPIYTENLSVENMIKNKCALVGPDGPEKMEYVKVDDYFPQTILNNLEKYQDMIIPGAEHTVYDFYPE